VGKAVVLAVVAIAVGLLVYLLARPRPAAPQSERIATVAPANPIERAPATVGGTEQEPAATGPIAPPRTEQEKEHDAIEKRRETLYGRLHQDLGTALVAVRPSDDDASTLELYAANAAPDTASVLLNFAFRANVTYYGFRHIRFYLPNPAGSIERFRLDAEASTDPSGNWQMFKK